MVEHEALNDNIKAPSIEIREVCSIPLQDSVVLKDHFHTKQCCLPNIVELFVVFHGLFHHHWVQVLTHNGTAFLLSSYHLDHLSRSTGNVQDLEVVLLFELRHHKFLEANDQSKSGSPLFFPANTFARQGDCSARSVQFDVASLGDKKK